ncbi:glycosyltransferase family 2 protein [Sphingomonas hankookensis]|uniref:glycosyltransferase family 2 protein n=1 Tax=Sphingomonas hankookensis TaxID=563996 RepID=UPI001F57B959
MSDTGAAPWPKISVVIPNYNRARTIVAAVESVLEQHFTDFEVIVVDDGSTDDSVAQLAAVTDPRLRVLARANGGASSARNFGIRSARGRYVAFLDSDDRFLPHHLSTMDALLDATETVAAYSPVIADRGGGRWIVKPPRPIGEGENMACYLMCDRGFVQTSGLVVPRAIAARVLYREDVSFGDDVDFAVRLQLAGCRFRMSDAPSVVWADDVRPDRLSHAGQMVDSIGWLNDLRPDIPDMAYRGYMGWHVAKGMMRRSPWRSTKLYARALFGRSYNIRMAAVIFLQIYVPQSWYRALADSMIALRNLGRRKIDGSPPVSRVDLVRRPVA